MKKKILIIFLLFTICLTTFSNKLFADSSTFDLNSIVPNSSDFSSPYNDYFNNGFFLQRTTYNVNYLYVFTDSETKCYIKSTSSGTYYLCFNKDTYYIRILDDGSLSGNFNKVNADFNNISTPVESAENYFLSTVPIYQSKTSNDIVLESNYVQDDTISDPSSDLQLSYEYNEDFTSCHINATLKNGAFTDKIYYSNLAPSISGQGLLTKRGFPVERYRYYR